MARLCRYCLKPFSRNYNSHRHENQGCRKRLDSESVGSTAMTDGFQEVPPHAAVEERDEGKEEEEKYKEEKSDSEKVTYSEDEEGVSDWDSAPRRQRVSQSTLCQTSRQALERGCV